MISDLTSTGEIAGSSSTDTMLSEEGPLSNEELSVLHKLLNHEDIISFLNILLGNLDEASIRIEEEIKLGDLAALFQVSNPNEETNNEHILFVLIQFLSMFNAKDHENNPISTHANLRMFNLQDLDMDQNKLFSTLQKVTEKLDVLLKQKNQFNRNEFLNQVFSSVIQGIEEQNSHHKNSLPALSNDPFLQQKLIYPNQITLTQGQTDKMVATDQLIRQFEAILAKSQFGNHRPGDHKSYSLNCTLNI